MRIFPIKRSVGKLDSETKQNLQLLVRKMHKKTNSMVGGGGYSFSSSYIYAGVLKENNNGVFGPTLSYLSDKYPSGVYSHVKLNDKEYVIDNVTGEVLPKKFSLKNMIFGASEKTISMISNVINSVKENFENSDIVEQLKVNF